MKILYLCFVFLAINFKNTLEICIENESKMQSLNSIFNSPNNNVNDLIYKESKSNFNSKEFIIYDKKNNLKYQVTKFSLNTPEEIIFFEKKKEIAYIFVKVEKNFNFVCFKNSKEAYIFIKPVDNINSTFNSYKKIEDFQTRIQFYLELSKKILEYSKYNIGVKNLFLSIRISGEEKLKNIKQIIDYKYLSFFGEEIKIIIKNIFKKNQEDHFYKIYRNTIFDKNIMFWKLLEYIAEKETFILKKNPEIISKCGDQNILLFKELIEYLKSEFIKEKGYVSSVESIIEKLESILLRSYNHTLKSFKNN